MIIVPCCHLYRTTVVNRSSLKRTGPRMSRYSPDDIEYLWFLLYAYDNVATLVEATKRKGHNRERSHAVNFIVIPAETFFPFHVIIILTQKVHYFPTK